MKRYNIDKIVKETKRVKKEENKLMEIINHLLPETTQELNEVIRINSMTNQDYF